MDRRALLAGLGALCSVGLGPGLALAGPAPGPGWVEALLADLERIRQHPPLPAVGAALARAGLPADLLGEAFAVLVSRDAWHGLDEVRQQDPQLVAWMLEQAARVPALVARLAGWLEAQGARGRARLFQTLRRPNRLMALLDRVQLRRDARFPARRAALRRSLGELAGALRGQDPEAWFTGLLHPLDQLFGEHGVDRRALAADPSAPESEDGALAPAGPLDGRPTSVKLGLLGLALQGLAAVVFVGGVGLFALGSAAGVGAVGAVGAVLCLGLAPLLLAVGTVLFLVGVVYYFVERQREPQDPFTAAPAGAEELPDELDVRRLDWEAAG